MLIAMIVNGQLSVQFCYNKKDHTRRIIAKPLEKLLFNMNLIVNYVIDAMGTLLTASDFDVADLLYFCYSH